jgi:hypothetical protein
MYARTHQLTFKAILHMSGTKHHCKARRSALRTVKHPNMMQVREITRVQLLKFNEHMLQ